MFVTEEQAKARWCPFVRVTIAGKLPTSMNRMQELGRDEVGATVARGETTLPSASRCIGSECMAWRKGSKFNPEYRERNHAWPDHREPHQRAPILPDETTGYCGLAGAPTHV